MATLNKLSRVRQGDPCSSVLILAAGMGKRMRSPLPKVLHSIGGQPLVFHILDRVRESAPKASIGIVVGHGREQVEAAIRANPDLRDLKISFIHQSEQKGTGHAARCAMDSSWGEETVEKKSGFGFAGGSTPAAESPSGRNVGAPEACRDDAPSDLRTPGSQWVWPDRPSR